MRKKIKNSTKTKILVGVMGVTAVAMIVGPCLSALAADETEFTTEVKPETDNSDDKDIAGIWYMKDYGLIAQFDFAEDGTYTMAYENDPGETGTWILEDGNNVVLDKGSDNEMTLEYDGETMFINYGDGDNSEKLELIRSIPEEEKEAARKTVDARKRTGKNFVFVNFLDGAGWIGRQADMREIHRCSDYVLNFQNLGLLEDIIAEHITEF